MTIAANFVVRWLLSILVALAAAGTHAATEMTSFTAAGVWTT